MLTNFPSFQRGICRHASFYCTFISVSLACSPWEYIKSEKAGTQELIVYHVAVNTLWDFLQCLCEKVDSDKPKITALLQSSYQHSILLLLAEIDITLPSGTPMFEPLLKYSEKTSSLDGLESIYLTLLPHASTSGTKAHIAEVLTSGSSIYAPALLALALIRA